MKKVLIGLLAILAIGILSGCVTKVVAEPYTEVVEVSGKTADELFVLINKWAVETFVEADSVIEFSDKESGTISGKYSSKVSVGLLRLSALSTMMIEVKDGRYRVMFSDPRYIDPAFPEGGLKPLEMSTAVSELKTKWISLAQGLAEYVKNGGDDW